MYVRMYVCRNLIYVSKDGWMDPQFCQPVEGKRPVVLSSRRGGTRNVFLGNLASLHNLRLAMAPKIQRR